MIIDICMTHYWFKHVDGNVSLSLCNTIIVRYQPKRKPHLELVRGQHN